MFTKFSTSLALVKIGFSYIKEEGELFVYALLSFFSSALILASFIVTDIFYIDTLDSLPNDQKQLITYAIMFFCYLVLYFITFFFNTAVITSVKRKLNREENSFGDGMRDSVKHL
jgi:TRAP-type C4-dicarboxylate transport system permease small subunit